jgi:hypothetical protein
VPLIKARGPLSSNCLVVTFKFTRSAIDRRQDLWNLPTRLIPVVRTLTLIRAQAQARDLPRADYLRAVQGILPDSHVHVHAHVLQ